MKYNVDLNKRADNALTRSERDIDYSDDKLKPFTVRLYVEEVEILKEHFSKEGDNFSQGLRKILKEFRKENRLYQSIKK